MFRNAWNLGTISGIKIRLHWSFLLVPMWVFYATLTGGGFAAAVSSVVLVLAIFGCVLLHELGHAFAARQFGIGTRDIILLPIGGVASLERMPRKPLQELWIAVAGPLVNVVIATVIFVGLAYRQSFGVVGGDAMSSFLFQLGVANGFLVVFNMIPAFPMDGGRVLRSFMAMFMPYVKATVIAAGVGKWCALLMFLCGLFYGPFMLIFLAPFVFLAGQAEKWQVLMGEQARQGGMQNGMHGVPPMFQQRQGQGQRASRGGPNSGQSNTQGAQGPAYSDRGFGAQGEELLSVPSTLSGDSVAAWLSNARVEVCDIVESGKIIGRITKTQLLTALAHGLGSLPIGQILSQGR